MKPGTKKTAALLSGPVLFLLTGLFADIVPENPKITWMLAIIAWVALWWLTEAVDLAVTSLLPFVLLPVTGILDPAAAAQQYMNPVIFLFVGGFLLAFAIEKWGLHRRIALRILMLMGSSPSKILFGVMITTFLMSMWISNTATTMMLISAVIAVIHQTDARLKENAGRFAAALLLALAYSASIGGMSTLVGTPTNMIFKGYLAENYEGRQVGFAGWMTMAFPLALVFLLISFLVIRRIYLHRITEKFHTSVFKEEYHKLGPVRYEERIVALVFSVTALLWFFRADMDFGGFKLKGWSHLFGNPKFIEDSTVAIAMALILFLIPAKNEKRMIMTWEEGRKLPYGIILLFGSGFALARGFDDSGFSRWLAGMLKVLHGYPVIFIVAGVCVLVTLLSEFASNVASIQLMLPLLAALSVATGTDPLVFMVPATLAASLGFMLPVATAPNTIVFGSGRVSVRQMMRTGFILDLIGIFLITMAMGLII